MGKCHYIASIATRGFVGSFMPSSVWVHVRDSW